MQTIPLSEFLKGRSQSEVAGEIGVIQPAVSKMVATGRDIYITVNVAGDITDAFEIKKIGRFARAENRESLEGAA